MTDERKTTTDLAQRDPGAGQIARQTPLGAELATQAETATAAAAALARANVEARYVMAARNPRDVDQVRTDLLAECKRKGAPESFWYRKPIGKGVEGLSVRFAEAALRAMRNVVADTQTTWDDSTKRIILVTVTDLESNITFPKSIVVEKTVERSSLKKGQTAIRTRTNSKGEPVYIVEATEDEMLGKENSAVSKAIRNGVMRLLPGALQDECRELIQKLKRQGIAEDPEAERHRIVDGFGALNVRPRDLKEWLGHDIGSASPAELEDLRDAWSAVKSGDHTWHELLEERLAEREAAKSPADAKPEPKAEGSTLDQAAAAMAAGGAEPPASPGSDDAFERGRRQARDSRTQRSFDK